MLMNLPVVTITLNFTVKCPECLNKTRVSTEPDSVQNAHGEFLIFCDDCMQTRYRDMLAFKDRK